MFQPTRIGSGKLYGLGLVSALAVILSGCAGESGSDTGQERVGQVIQPIIRGITSGTEHDSVVILATFSGGMRKSLCSATLVAPNLVLTARHCVSDTDSSTACSMDGTPVAGATVHADRAASSLAIFVGKDGVAADSSIEANATAHGSKLVVDAATTVCNRDLAFVVLEKKVDAPVAQIRLGAPLLTEKLSAVGWGINEMGQLPTSRQERHDIPLIGLGPGLYPENQNYGYGNAEFMVGESACAGDSGSPAMAASGAVVGVAARAGNGKAKDPSNQASTCMGDTAHAVYTHLGNAPELVARAFSEAGEAPWLEGQPDPRAPKPANVPDPSANAGAKTSETPSGNEQKSAQADLPLPAAEEPKGEAGGCSMSSEPQNGSVEYAAGLVALFASLIGLRRRFTKKGREEAAIAETHRERLPSMP